MHYMLNSQDYEQNPIHLPLNDKIPLSIFILLPFLVATISVSVLPGWNYLVIGLGAICTFSFLLASLRDGFHLTGEIWLFIAFICWSVLGLFVAMSTFLVLNKLRTLVQILIMLLFLVYYTRNIRSIDFLFFAILIGILIVAVSAVVSGDYQRGEEVGERVEGLLMNANSFAFAANYGIIILFYFFRRFRSIIIKLGIIAAILIGVNFVVLSGSRKGIAMLGAFTFLWFLFTYGSEVKEKPYLLIFAVLGLFALGTYTVYKMEDSTLLKRLSMMGVGEQEADSSALTRFDMMRRGIDLTFENPIFGVGLNNFRVHFSGRYAHNNYAEVFSNTGIIGGLLYFSIYISIFMRILKLRKYPLTKEQKDMLVVCAGFMLVKIPLEIGYVSYYSKYDWIFLSIIIGFLYYTQKDIESQQLEDEDIMYDYED